MMDICNTQVLRKHGFFLRMVFDTILEFFTIMALLYCLAHTAEQATKEAFPDACRLKHWVTLPLTLPPLHIDFKSLGDNKVYVVGNRVALS